MADALSVDDLWKTSVGLPNTRLVQRLATEWVVISADVHRRRHFLAGFVIINETPHGCDVLAPSQTKFEKAIVGLAGGVRQPGKKCGDLILARSRIEFAD